MAEDIAAEFLTAQDYRVVARNHRCPVGEIDVIAWDCDVLCFVEVRSVSDGSPMDALKTITPSKIRRVIAAARDYVDQLRGPWPLMRFDAVGIFLADPPQVTLIREAFEE